MTRCIVAFAKGTDGKGIDWWLAWLGGFLHARERKISCRILLLDRLDCAYLPWRVGGRFGVIGGGGVVFQAFGGISYES